MDARVQSVQETRQRIIRAATDLHSEQGVLATSWEEIAERAGVAPATVYRHFPSLVELIPACARSTLDVIKVPTLEEAAPKFAHLATPAQRLELLIRESCRCYAAGEGWLHAARREADLVPAVGQSVRVQTETLSMLVRAATDGLELPEDAIAALFVFCDFPFWKSLKDAGLPEAGLADLIVQLAFTYLERQAQSIDGPAAEGRS